MDDEQKISEMMDRYKGEEQYARTDDYFAQKKAEYIAEQQRKQAEILNSYMAKISQKTHISNVETKMNPDGSIDVFFTPTPPIGNLTLSGPAPQITVTYATVVPLKYQPTDEQILAMVEDYGNYLMRRFREGKQTLTVEAAEFRNKE